VAHRTDISVVLGVGGARRAELSEALTHAALVVADEPGAARAFDAATELVPDVVLIDEHDGRIVTGGMPDATAHARTRVVLLVDADDTPPRGPGALYARRHTPSSDIVDASAPPPAASTIIAARRDGCRGRQRPLAPADLVVVAADGHRGRGLLVRRWPRTRSTSPPCTT
jgi:hypothetical protein